MIKITDKGQLDQMVTAVMKPGVYTNCFIEPDEYAEMVASGGLYAHQGEGFLLILRNRGTHQLLNFYMLPGAAADACLEGDIVTEVPLRQKDKEREPEIIDFLHGLGFQRCLDRIRLERQPDDFDFMKQAADIQLAYTWDLDSAYELLQESFDIHTGCIPLRQQFSRDINARRVLCAHDQWGDVVSLLHYTDGKNFTQIRHLATKTQLRGQGLAQQVFNRFAAINDGRKTRTWTGRENTSALNFYKRNGYQPDGWYSIVFKRMESK